MKNDYLFRDRHNISWFYPKLCKFQDEPDKITDKLCMNYTNDNIQKLLYIHIPFCESFCSYCACFKELLQKYSYEERKRFVESLIKEMKMLRALNNNEKIKVKYIQFGGGTPSCLDNDLLSDIFNGINENFDLSENTGISFEGNVMTLKDLNKLRLLKDFGVSRVSFGVQTFNKILRRQLNIKAQIGDIFKTVENLNIAGIDSFALDLIYNLPNQTLEILENDLEIACKELKPTFIQTYQFNQFSNTGLSKRIKDGYFDIIPTQEREMEEIRFISEKMKENGYKNRVLINLFSNVDTKPWTGIDLSLGNNKLNGSYMIGLGPGSMSYLSKTNHRNYCSVKEYIEALDNNKLPIECGHVSSEEERMNKVMVCFPAFTKIKKKDIPNDSVISQKLKKLEELEYIKEDGEFIHLTDTGLEWAGNISYYFHSDDELKKIQKSFYQSLKNHKNPFNQDDMNVVK